MTTYSFKSSGKTQETKNNETLKKSSTPYGIKTPIQLGTSTGIFSMTYSLIEQVDDNLRNLLLTNWGEHLGIYNFGANLRPLTTELVSQEDFDSAAIERIRSAVSKWMPFVDLQTFTSSNERLENNKMAVIKITITYDVPGLSVTNKALQIVLYSM